MDKGELRKVMRARRKAMSAQARAAASKTVCAKLLARDDIRKAITFRQPIAVYLASSEEVDLTDFIVATLSQGAALVAPRWTGSRYELSPLMSLGTLVSGPHGILEPPASCALPSPPAIWLVPGLAFTKDGKRLGYGGGWYDRLLEESDRKSLKIGISFSFQIVNDLPLEPHDHAMTEVMSVPLDSTPDYPVG